MTTLAARQRNRAFATSEYYPHDSTSPGVAVAEALTEHTDTGDSNPADAPTWERLRVLLAHTDWLNYPLYLFRDRTGRGVLLIVTTAESQSAQAREDEQSQFPSFGTQIATIRSALSLQMKELAEAVGVERPTIYSWINEQNLPQPANRQRLHAIYRLAQQWNRLSKQPLGKALHRVDTEEGCSVFDLLRQASIPAAALVDRFRAFASATQPRKKPASVRELAEKHGIDLSRTRDSQDEIDLETGKRIVAE